MIGFMLPCYAVIVLLQQTYATTIGTEILWKEDDPLMDPTCQFEVDAFFLNEVVVGVITLIQIVAALLFKKMKSRHLREIEGDVNVSSKRVQFYANEIKESRERSLKNKL